MRARHLDGQRGVLLLLLLLLLHVERGGARDMGSDDARVELHLALQAHAACLQSTGQALSQGLPLTSHNDDQRLVGSTEAQHIHLTNLLTRA